MENWDTHFQALYRCQASALEGELSSPLCRCSAAGRSCICFGDSYIWKRWKMRFHHDSHFLPCTTTNSTPSCHAICILCRPAIRFLYQSYGFINLFWLRLISNFLPMLCLPCSWPVAGDPTGQPAQPEAALPALLEAGGVAVLAARADPGRHHAVNVQGGAEGETSVPLRHKLELLWKIRGEIIMIVKRWSR